jgi:hypothetical protein
MEFRSNTNACSDPLEGDSVLIRGVKDVVQVDRSDEEVFILKVLKRKSTTRAATPAARQVITIVTTVDRGAEVGI